MSEVEGVTVVGEVEEGSDRSWLRGLGVKGPPRVTVVCAGGGGGVG